MTYYKRSYMQIRTLYKVSCKHFIIKLHWIYYKAVV